MKLKNKIWMISFICLGAGILLLIVGMLFGGKPGFYFDNNGFHVVGENRREDYTLKKTPIDEFENIEMNLEYADLEIILSDDYYIEYNVESDVGKPFYEVTDKTLNFYEANRKEEWTFSFFTIGTPTMYGNDDYFVKLYIPKDAVLDSVTVEQADGEITLPNLKVKNLSLNNSYGDIRLKDIKAEDIELFLSDGDISTGKLEADTVQLENTYGDVKLDDIQAKSLTVYMSDGDLKVNDLDAKQIDIENAYGDVKLRMKHSLEDYSLDILAEYGDLTIPGYAITTDEDGEEKTCRIEKDSEKWLRIDGSDGDIEVITR